MKRFFITIFTVTLLFACSNSDKSDVSEEYRAGLERDSYHKVNAAISFISDGAEVSPGTIQWDIIDFIFYSTSWQKYIWDEDNFNGEINITNSSTEFLLNLVQDNFLLLPDEELEAIEVCFYKLFSDADYEYKIIMNVRGENGVLLGTNYITAKNDSYYPYIAVDLTGIKRQYEYDVEIIVDYGYTTPPQQVEREITVNSTLFLKNNMNGKCGFDLDISSITFHDDNNVSIQGTTITEDLNGGQQKNLNIITNRTVIIQNLSQIDINLRNILINPAQAYKYDLILEITNEGGSIISYNKESYSNYLSKRTLSVKIDDEAGSSIYNINIIIEANAANTNRLRTLTGWFTPAFEGSDEIIYEIKSIVLGHNNGERYVIDNKYINASGSIFQNTYINLYIHGSADFEFNSPAVSYIEITFNKLETFYESPDFGFFSFVDILDNTLGQENNLSIGGEYYKIERKDIRPQNPFIYRVELDNQIRYMPNIQFSLAFEC